MGNIKKVVLLCHYWSDEMAEMVGRKHYFRELSPWIQETLNMFKNKVDVELHVVAPNYASNYNLDCQREGINYHFYHYSPTWLSTIIVPLIKLFLKHQEPYKIAERFANTLTGFKTPSKNAVRIIRKINPDLVHLYGSENPDYAAPAAIVMNEYPMLLSIQGYVYLQEPSKMFLKRKFYDFRVMFERIINTGIRFLILNNHVTLEEAKNNDAHFFANCERLFYVTAITKVPKIDSSNVEKKYDLVYYARIDKEKGIEDLIEVVALLKKQGRSLKTLIMGRGMDSYINQLKAKIKDGGLSDLIDFAGFIEHHEDVYKLAAQARLMVLPTHNDQIPNSIREAMFMKLPVVANNIGGIPQFNQNRKCVHLVEMGDMEGLANGVCLMLDNETYREELITNACCEAQEVYSPDAVYEQTVNAYKDIVKQLKK